MISRRGMLVLAAGAWAAGAGFVGCSDSEVLAPQSFPVVAGAAYTTFDATLGGCIGGSAVNCNIYASKESVFASGGPAGQGLSDGDYTFTVLAPGAQNGGFIDGAPGNLSSPYDAAANRTFTVTDHEITSYPGTHALGQSESGRTIVQLVPYDDTPNPGGVYILAVCAVGATDPSECKYDAFKVRRGEEPPPPPFPVVSGLKYYDRNANGVFDDGEVGIAGWPIDLTDQIAETVPTGSDGTFTVELLADTYEVAERAAPPPWQQTGNRVSQLGVTGGAQATLAADMTYTLVLIDGSEVTGVNFGNLCVGGGGGRTLGFWSNKNGAALFGTDDLALMVSLNLRNGVSAPFDPVSYAKFRTWLLSATAANMAYMLSAQLAAMELNVHNGFVDPDALILATGTNGANPSGFATVATVMAEANQALANPEAASRVWMEALKDALDAANNNRTFVQPGPEACPTPEF